MRILVIDDYEPFAYSLRLMLTGHQVAVATDGAAALERLLEGEPADLILCDLTMAEVSGPDLFLLLRDHRPELTGRLVFMTGGAYTAEQRAFVRAVPNACLEKPFSLAAVEAELAKRV